MLGWPNPSAQMAVREGEWMDCRPTCRLFFQEKDLPVENITRGAFRQRISASNRPEFYAAFPEKIRNTVSLFATHQWNLLELFSRKREIFQELMRDNPVLGYCLANGDYFRQIYNVAPVERAQWLLGRTERYILDWLKFPNEKTIAKIFKKIEPENLELRQMRLLRYTLCKEPRARKLLSHHRKITSTTLSLVYDKRIFQLLSDRFVLELSERAFEGSLADFIIDTYALLMELRPNEECPVLNSLEKLEKLHHELTDLFNCEMQKLLLASPEHIFRKGALRSGQFPPPPIEGTEHIVPVTCERDLVSEGIEQSNCVGSYADRIRSGHSYIYKVLAPERGTLEIRCANGSTWYLVQLTAAHNGKVDTSTRQTIQRWLQQRMAQLQETLQGSARELLNLSLGNSVLPRERV